MAEVRRVERWRRLERMMTNREAIVNGASIAMESGFRFSWSARMVHGVAWLKRYYSGSMLFIYGGLLKLT